LLAAIVTIAIVDPTVDYAYFGYSPARAKRDYAAWIVIMPTLSKSLSID